MEHSFENVLQQTNNPNPLIKPFEDLNMNGIIENDTFQNKYLYNIIFLYLIRSYRGWRHIFSLPTAGQRTKSNSNTPKKNTILKNEMFNIFKDGLKSFHPSEVRNSFLLEQLNWYWLKLKGRVKYSL